MSKSHLQQRATGWFYRRGIPARYHEAFGKREWIQKLGQMSRPEAERQEKLIDIQFEDALSRAKAGEILDPQVKPAIAAGREVGRASLFASAFGEPDPASVEARYQGFARQGAATVQEEFAEATAMIDAWWQEQRAVLRGTISLRPDLDTASLQRLLRRIGQAIDDEFRRVVDPENAPPDPAGPGAKLNDMIPIWVREVGPVDQSKREAEHAVGQFQAMHPDLTIKATRREHVAGFATLLHNAPKFATDNTLPLAVQIDAARSANPEYQRLSPRTVKQRIIWLSTLFNIAISQGIIEHNPALKMGPKEKVIKKAAQPRDLYTPAELQKLTGSPLFMGCKSHARRALPGDLVIQDWKYWIPIMGAYTGARVGELAQITLESIEDDLPWIDFRKLTRLKNDSARRVVPIHRDLIRLGLMDRVTELRKEGETLLFPDAPPPYRGKPGHMVSKWYGQYMDAIKMSDPELVYHSFRHTMIDEISKAGWGDGDYYKAFIGHRYGGAEDNYKRRNLATQIKPLLDQIDVGIEIESLCRAAKR